MEYDKDGDPDYDAWFKKNKQYLPEEHIDSLQQGIDLIHFYSSVYLKVMKKLTPAIRKLMKKQYPVFRNETRPLVVEDIDTIATTTGTSLLWSLRTLLNNQYAGVNVREKYPEFERWVEFYVRPKKPTTIDESTRSEYFWLSDDQWEEFRDSENKASIQYFNWEQKRTFEFIDVVQTILFKYFKELEELNADELIMYAVHIRDEYEYYLSSCEHIELFIDCGFPEEDIKLSYEEFMTSYSALNAETRDYAESLRDRRINGEEI